MTTRILGIVVVLACSVTGTAEATTNLKPFDPVALQGVAETTAKELLLPGAMVLLRTPQGDFAFGYGATELGGTIPPRADTHFRAASNTKTMTAAVIVLLVQEGKLRFDDPVSRYAQRVPNGDNITISQLLKMRSGLYNYTSAPELAESLDHDPTRAWTPEELLAIAFKRPQLFAPGTEYDYCNTNYALLGLIAEKLEGAPLAKIFQDRLFGPLGMKHTLLPANTSLFGWMSTARVDALRNHVMQQSQPFSFEPRGELIHAGDVAAWSIKARHDPGLYRVVTHGEYDWNRRSCFFCARNPGAARYENGDLSLNKLGYESRKSFKLTIREAILDGHVLARDVAGVL